MSEESKSESSSLKELIRLSLPVNGKCLLGLCRGLALLWPVLLQLLAPVPSFSQTGQAIQPGDVLPLSRAIEIALEAQPAILAARYTLRANEARIGEAEIQLLSTSERLRLLYKGFTRDRV